ncbi:hypothetical protein GCM10010329_23830 [Streptomyces spiroverticillatus]|uniref:DUF3159 domain-containing protein n=1 Tax=Streptomyces finlayi TaxID=67296 RepID=A0A919C999_9ACTN|nr:DUF3159 domain-containing protein [Streptomyces finlayi]GHA01373.1 hypothetical protein GCM10010329_23830 [Streptomyces spiroverticillatus]GHC85792.1 hypothetical protein GCM10010334_16250 [Streptomyces finlayi]
MHSATSQSPGDPPDQAVDDTSAKDRARKVPADFQGQLAYAWAYIGGVHGTVLSVLPVIAYIAVNAAAGMWPAIWSSLGTAALVGVWQLLRKEKPAAALIGLGTAVITCGAAVLAGEAKGYYLIGNWITVGIGSLLLLSVLVRRPLIGQVWAAANSQGTFWRTDRRSLLHYDLATVFWALLCFSRFAVERWLYNLDETTWLGIVRLLMGWPLTFVVVLNNIWAVRKVDARRKLYDPDYRAR